MGCLYVLRATRFTRPVPSATSARLGRLSLSRPAGQPACLRQPPACLGPANNAGSEAGLAPVTPRCENSCTLGLTRRRRTALSSRPGSLPPSLRDVDCTSARIAVLAAISARARVVVSDSLLLGSCDGCPGQALVGWVQMVAVSAVTMAVSRSARAPKRPGFPGAPQRRPRRRLYSPSIP